MSISLAGCGFGGASLVAALVVSGCTGPEENEADPRDEAIAIAAASSAGCAVLARKDRPIFWDGIVGPEDAPSGGEPAECAQVSCDRLRLRLALPHGTFHKPNKPGGVVIGLRWPNASNTLNLFVYRGNTLVASSAGIIATSQAVFLPEPDNGLYTLWIAADPSYNLDSSVPYEAFAEVEYRPKIPPVREVLPDLEFRAPRNVRFATPSFPLFEPDPPPGATCFNSETDEDGAHLCLRFDQVIANIGVAPLEVREAIPKDPSNPALNAFQRIYNSDGTFVDAPAGDFEYHPIHQHYHYKSFAISTLWRSDAAGDKLGAAPIRSTRKLSFCIADIEIDRWGEPGVARRTYFAPDCLMPLAEDADFDYLIVGLGDGWADVYDWFLPGQYVEVSGVADGHYLLESCADPDGKLRESDETNNCIDTLIRLSGMSTSSPQVETLGSP